MPELSLINAPIGLVVVEKRIICTLLISIRSMLPSRPERITQACYSLLG
jgi:hypothetical protein